MLGLAVLADSAQLAFIIGAFMAGLAIGRSGQHERIANDLNSIGGVLIPVFFVLIGVNADVGAMFQPSVLLDAAVLLVIAVAGKIVSAYGAAGTRSDRLLIGLGMIPRGEVGLIFASIGLAQGVLDDELYGALLLVVLMTTVITPPLLRWRIAGKGRADVGELDDDVDAPSRPTAGPRRGTAGSCSTDGRRRARSPSSRSRPLRSPTTARRPDELLTWFGERRDVDVDWTLDDTNALARRAAPRRAAGRAPARRHRASSSVACPSVAEALARRRADPSELDPGRALRFPTVARLADQPVDPTAPWIRPRGAGPERDARGAGDRRARHRRVAAARSTSCSPSWPSTDPPTVERTIEAARLLRAAASDVDGYDRAETDRSWPPTSARSPCSIRRTRWRSPARRTTTGATDSAQVRELLAEILAHPELLGRTPPRWPTPGGGRRWRLAGRRRARGADSRTRPTATCWPTRPTSWPARPGSSSRCPARGPSASPSARRARPTTGSSTSPCRDADGLLARLADALDGVRLRHRRSHRRHVARRRRRRHVPRPRRRAPAERGDWPTRSNRRSARHRPSSRDRPCRRAVRQRRRARGTRRARSPGATGPGMLAALAGAFAVAGVDGAQRPADERPEVSSSTASR